MDDNQKGKPYRLVSKVLDIFRRIVDYVAPGLPVYARASILILVIVAIFIVVCILVCMIGGTEWRVVFRFALLFSVLSVFVLISIFLYYYRKNTIDVEQFPEQELTGHNTMALNGRLTSDERGRIVAFLRAAAGKVADELSLPKELVRSNIFGTDEHDSLSMIKDLSFRMDHPEELTIKMPVGYGSTGRCFQTCNSNIAVLENDWGKDVIDDEELRKIHPQLQWILSVPVLSTGDNPRPIWVLNIDGLRERRSAADVRCALRQVYKYSEAISLLLGHATQVRGAIHES